MVELGGQIVEDLPFRFEVGERLGRRFLGEACRAGDEILEGPLITVDELGFCLGRADVVPIKKAAEAGRDPERQSASDHIGVKRAHVRE